jgi:hypothetical protein
VRDAGDSPGAVLIAALLYAYNVGASGVSLATVNTVTFASYVFPSAPAQTVTVGSVTFTESPGYLWGSNCLGGRRRR